MKIKEYGTGKVLGDLNSHQTIGQWCYQHSCEDPKHFVKYLPHHSVPGIGSGAWYVVKIN